jgi:transposase
MTDLKRVRTKARASTGFIYKTYYEQIELKLRERRDTIKWPSQLGIDEHFFSRRRGSPGFVTVFTDLGKRRLFEVALGKDTKGLIEQVSQIPGREQVKTVCIDMSKTYRALIKKLFPNAQIVADKFHVLRLLSSAIIKERRRVQGDRHNAQTRRLLLCNRHRLDYFERSEIDRLLVHHPELDALYRAKERLHEIYRTKGLRRVSQALERFTAQLSMSRLDPLEKLARTLKTWRKEILKYFETRLTNAFTEHTNNRGKLVQKRAYGYRSFRNYRLRLLSACLHEACAA